MIKQILRLLFLLAMYELGKYVTEQVYIIPETVCLQVVRAR
ncbi:hypothetical protein I5C44_15020 [Staphylococcus aureus]|nr:hypothetical protein I5C44_15020 [Staphylococcus aureus]